LPGPAIDEFRSPARSTFTKDLVDEYLKEDKPQ
jgi:hypothetical protein